MKVYLLGFLFTVLFAHEACNQSDVKKDPYNADIMSIDEYLKGKTYEGMETAIIAGGCFWCVEAALQQIDGIVEAISGYAGGDVERPDYKLVCTHTTGHTEAVYLIYDPSIISFGEILDIFFDAHDPTTKDRQGPDVGNSYRSALFYQNEAQQKVIEQKIQDLNESTFGGKIVTEVSPYDIFWVAEEYHQDFYWNNPNQGYVRGVSRPKVEKIAKKYKDRLKAEYK